MEVRVGRRSQAYQPRLALARGRLGGGWRARSASTHGLCHPVSVTYDPGRRTRSAGGSTASRPGIQQGSGSCAARRVARAAARPARSRSPRIPGGSGPIGRAAPVAQTDLARPVHLDLRLACLRAAGARRAHGVGGVLDRHRNQRVRAPQQDAGAGAGAAHHRRGQHVDRRRTAQGADPVRRQPADRHPARRRALHRGGRQDLAHRAGRGPEGRSGHRQGVHLHRRGRGRHRHHRVRRRRELRADGQPDPGQPEELDAQPAVRVHPDRQRPARLPGVADHPDDGPGGLRLRDSHRDVLLQPVLRARRPAAGVPQRGPLGARRGAVPG